MIRRILLTLLLPLPLLAQTTVRGIVTEQNSGNRPVPGVQIKALGSAPELSDNAGAFRLAFAAKKPGDRIVVTGVTKAGYEIVNKDVVANWLIPSDPQARTKIVMCPEGAIARNILKYYDISSAALTRVYRTQVRALQERLDRAEIDAKSYGEQARVLGERYEQAQNHMETLAERFARENFDDCSAVQREAFSAFSAGNVEEAIRILESVNSEEEIAKAKAQKEKGGRLKAEGARMVAAGASMQEESDSLISQHVVKLRFQGDLYYMENRFSDAERSYQAALAADSTDTRSTLAYLGFLRLTGRYADVVRFAGNMQGLVPSATDRAWLLAERGQACTQLRLDDDAERDLLSASRVFADHLREDTASIAMKLSTCLEYLTVLYMQQRKWEAAETTIRRSIDLQRLFLREGGDARLVDCIVSLNLLGHTLRELQRSDEAQRVQREALAMMVDLRNPDNDDALSCRALVISELAILAVGKRQLSEAGRCFSEAYSIFKHLASVNPGYYSMMSANATSNMGGYYRDAGRLDSAEWYFVQAVALYSRLAEFDPEQYALNHARQADGLSGFYATCGKYREAEPQLRTALAGFRVLAERDLRTFAPYLTRCLYDRAGIYRSLGMQETEDSMLLECIAYTRKLVVLDSATHLRDLAALLINIARAQVSGHLDRSIDQTREALRIQHILRARQAAFHVWEAPLDNIARCNSLLARFMILSGRFREAEDHARQSLDASGNNRRYVKNLAHSLVFQGKFDEAKALYEEFLTLNVPDMPDMRQVLGADFSEFERAGITHPDVARIRALLTAPQESGK